MTDRTNKELSQLRKEMIEKSEKLMREVKNNKRTQSVPNKRNYEQNTPKMENQNTNNEDGKTNASNVDNRENRTQDNPFRPSELNELRSHFQPIYIQNFDSDDAVIMDEDST